MAARLLKDSAGLTPLPHSFARGMRMPLPGVGRGTDKAPDVATAQTNGQAEAGGHRGLPEPSALVQLWVTRGGSPWTRSSALRADGVGPLPLRTAWKPNRINWWRAGEQSILRFMSCL